MADQNITTKDAAGVDKNLRAKLNGDGSLNFYHVEDEAQRNALLAALNGLSSASAQTTGNTSLAAINTKLGGTIVVTDTPTKNAVDAVATALGNKSTSALQTTGNTSLAAIDTKLGSTISVADTVSRTSLGAIDTKLADILANDKPVAGNVTGSFTATGNSTHLVARRDFNVSVWGTFSATLRIERSFDSGTTWLPLTALGSLVTFTTPFSETFYEPEASVRYRVVCSAFTSGTINYRISQ